jgi:hypothetical protein
LTLLTANHCFLSGAITAIGPRGDGLPRPANRWRSILYPHFEGVELQGERRKRQPQIVRFFDPRIVSVLHGGFGLRFEASAVGPVCRGV